MYKTFVIGGDDMKHKLARISLLTNKISRQHIQLALTILALAMLVLGAGAPDAGGLGGG